MSDLRQRLRGRRLDTTAAAMLREARLRGYDPPRQFTDGEWHEVEVHRAADGREAVFVDGVFAEGDREYARQIRQMQEKIDDD